ncbi:MAG: hypothetical protein QM767_05265 [Anaeromyxobacter sp.]
MSLRLGVDFDNTLICYDGVFHRIAVERGLVPAAVPASKEAVRDHLRTAGREDDWTELQGLVYGARIGEARPFEDALRILAGLVRDGVPVRIISHKTRWPFRGPRADLHAAALGWLQAHGLLESGRGGAAPGGRDLRRDARGQARGHRGRRLHPLPRRPAGGAARPRVPGRHPPPPLRPRRRQPRCRADPRARVGRAAGPARLRGEGGRVSASPSPAALAARCLPGLVPAEAGLAPLPGGGNNRLYLLDAPGRRCVLKHYFRHPAQPHDRLQAEFSFLRLAWDGGLRNIPEPVGRDDGAGAAVYAFVPGRRLLPGEAGADDVAQALGFLVELDRRVRASAASLRPAAEACFSVREHLARVAARVARLEGLPVKDDASAEAAGFVAAALVPAWRRVRAAAEAGLAAAPGWAEPLGEADRVLSPSDFGFHNALRQEGGRLAFLDFEYAGWDDPAKLVNDFYFQPAVPAPADTFAAFARGVAALVRDPEGALARTALLRPALGIKWCCILLNHFTAVDGARRAFAAAGAPQRRAAQLERARALLRTVEGA